MKNLPYIGIIILLLVVLFQNKSCKQPDEPILSKIDTVIVYKYIHDTIPGEPRFIAAKIDTSIWMKKADFKPDTTYKGLLKQYEELGNRYFTTNTFKTDFKIADYGYISVTDSIYGNWLMNSTIFTDLNIPTTTITIEKEAPKKNEFYIGGTLTLSKTYPVSGIYGGFLMKNKKDQIYGINIGYNGEPQIGASLYYKLKLK